MWWDQLSADRGLALSSAPSRLFVKLIRTMPLCVARTMEATVGTARLIAPHLFKVGPGCFSCSVRGYQAPTYFASGLSGIG